MGAQARVVATFLLVTALYVQPCAAEMRDSTAVFWVAEGGYSAFKDELNVGLVYQGGMVGGSYAQRYANNSGALTWEVALNTEIMGTRGLTAIGLHLRPWDVGYLFDVVTDDWWLGLGAGFTGSYRLYVNPMQQSGSFFWYTHYDLELRIAARFRLKDQRFRVGLASAMFTLTSRPVPQPDPYYYDWNFGRMIERAHSNMTLGSLDLAQNLMVSVEWFIPNSHQSLAFETRAGSYNMSPTLSTLSHSLRFTWY